MVIAQYVTNGNTAFYLVIIRYVTRFSRVETTPFEPTKLLIALKDICNA